MVGNATSLVEAHHNDIVAAPTVWEDDGKQIGHRWCVFPAFPVARAINASGHRAQKLESLREQNSSLWHPLHGHLLRC
jgi:hypothetical protein